VGIWTSVVHCRVVRSRLDGAAIIGALGTMRLLRQVPPGNQLKPFEPPQVSSLLDLRGPKELGNRLHGFPLSSLRFNYCLSKKLEAGMSDYWRDCLKLFLY
jgi:hypothetical protein